MAKKNTAFLEKPLFRKPYFWLGLYLLLCILTAALIHLQFSAKGISGLLVVVALTFVFMPVGFFVLVSGSPATFLGSGDEGASNFLAGSGTFPALIIGWAFIILSIVMIRKAKNWRLWAVALLIFYILSFVGCLQGLGQ